MGQKLLIGPIQKGLRNDVLPFNVDNDSFPVLINAYEWRQRVKRKRGTELLGRLNRQLIGLSTATQPYYNSLGNTDVAGAFSGTLSTIFSLSSSLIVPQSISIKIDNGVDPVQTFTDDGQGNLSNGSSGTGTINYATSAITFQSDPVLASSACYIIFSYYPATPVLGLEPFVNDSSSFPIEIGFDQTYSYNISLTNPYPIHSVSFYWNPPVTFAYTNYVPKTEWTPVNWNLADYQQVWTTNYEGSLWATPGIPSPYATTNIGMQFKPIVSVTIVSPAAPAQATLQITAHGLSVGDFVFINEVVVTTGINFQTGYVITVSDPNNVVVEFPNASIGSAGNGGIAQYLTRSADSTKDCIRVYTGSPVTNATPPVFGNTGGWVNFCPPLSEDDFEVGTLPEAQYYLVNARMIVPFKDRLLFLGPVVQTSTGTPIYLQDTIIYSQNGTPYYTCSFQGDPSLSTTTFNPILVPVNQTATASAWWENQAGLGGFISAGYSRPITSVSPNEDALIVGFADRQARVLYTGNDLLPFSFYIVNSELGSEATFSTVTLDRGVLSVGGRGIILTSQIASQRVDLAIPDEVFEIRLQEQGARRIAAQRNFINEWVIFTVPSEQKGWKFPTRTLFYNYRENTWAIFNECFTTYGLVRRFTGDTWLTIGTRFRSWNAWSVPWTAGSTNLLQPEILGGNQQGFVIFRDKGTSEAASLYISDLVPSGGSATVTSNNHCLDNGDFVIVTDVLGSVGATVNNIPFQVQTSTSTPNSFALRGRESAQISGTYEGGGVITRCYRPFIQTKQFPGYWDQGRRTRIGNQMYLLTKTSTGQAAVYMYLSQNSATPYNTGPIVPEADAENNALIYSTYISTANEQYIQDSTGASLGNVGNGVDTSYTFYYQNLFAFNGALVRGSVTITIGSVATFIDDGVGAFNVTGTASSGTINYISGTVVLNFSAAPTNESSTTNFQHYYIDIQNPIANQQGQIWHLNSTSLIGDTVQLAITLTDDQMLDLNLQLQFEEIELHSMMIDLFPSQYLA